MIHLVGEGFSSADCGTPQAYKEFQDGTRVWGPVQCTSRQCPICCDHRYLNDAADDITRTVFAWVMYYIAKHGLYDDKGRSLKIYSFIYSRRENDENINGSRKACRETLQKQGMRAGYSILHPYRGSHAEKATPSECRDAMDRERLSVHYHGIAIGYWSSALANETREFYRSTCLMDLRLWVDSQMPIILRNKIMKKAQYALGHAGYYTGGQCVSSWGDRPSKEKKEGYMPPRPDVFLKHPTMTFEGEPVWERRTGKADTKIWVELEKMTAEAERIDYSVHRDKSYENILPHNGETRGLYPWYHISEIDQEEWHDNWGYWRGAIKIAIESLIVLPSAGR